MTNADRQSTASKFVRWWPLPFVLLHATKLYLWFAKVEFASPYSIVNHDFIFYYARALRFHEFLKRSGRFWGYDPFHMAGYLSGPIHEVGNLLNGLFCHALAPVMPIRISMILFVFVALLIAPVAVFWAAGEWGGARDEAWGAFAVTVCLFGFLDPITRGLITRGVFGFQIGLFVSILTAGFAYRWAASSDVAAGLGTVLGITAVLLLNPVLALFVAPPLLCFTALRVRNFDPAWWAKSVGLFLLLVALNLFWIRPYLAFSAWRDWVPNFTTAGWLAFWRTIWMDPNDTAFSFLVAAFQLLLLTFAGLALRRIGKRDPRLLLAGSLWLAAAWIIGYFGSAFPWIRTLQPARFGIGFWALVWFFAGMEAPGRVRKPPVFVIAVYLAIVIGHLALPEFLHGRFVSRLPPGQEPFVSDFLRTDARPGRFLMECDEEDEPNFIDLIPFLDGQATLGGSNPGNFLITRFTIFAASYYQHDMVRGPVIFGRALESFSESDFGRYMDLYDVTWIAARAPASVRVLNGFIHLLEPAPTRGDYHVYRVKRDANPFAEGSGEVTADYDRISVAHPSSGRSVLKFHWLETLRSDQVRLSPVKLLDDPVPFVSYEIQGNPPPSVVVRNAGLGARAAVREK